MDCRERGGPVDDGPGVLCDARASKLIWVLAPEVWECCFAQSAEELTYNAMLGSRNRAGRRTVLWTIATPWTAITTRTASVRSSGYKYSPTHSEPAVCCVPNWKELDLFSKSNVDEESRRYCSLMYGPSTLNTQVEGQRLPYTTHELSVRAPHCV